MADSSATTKSNPNNQQIQSMNIIPSKGRVQGFSLVELLVVIAVIGILAGVAIPALSNINETSRKVKAQKQAQNIASVFASGRVAGAPGFSAATSVETAMDAVGIGSNGGGAMSSIFFGLPGVSATMDAGKSEEEQAKHYLSFAGGNLSYEPAGGSSDSAPVQWGPWEFVVAVPDQQTADSTIASLQQQHPTAEYQKDFLPGWVNVIVRYPL